MHEPQPITNMIEDPTATEDQIRNWFFALLPPELAAYNVPNLHFAYLFELHDREQYQQVIEAGMLRRAEATTDQNYMNHIRTFEYALNNGLGAPAYASAYALTYRLGIIAVHKQEPETNLRILAFLNLLDLHASDQ